MAEMEELLPGPEKSPENGWDSEVVKKKDAREW